MKGTHAKALGSHPSALLVLVLLACGRVPPRSAEAPCPQRQGTVVLGFEHAAMGENELPIGFFCGPRMDQPAPRVSQVDVSFTPEKASKGEVVPGTVVYRPAARVLESTNGPGLRFDYVVKVALRRAGNWLMELRYQAPWSAEQVKTTMVVHVKEPEGPPATKSE